MARSLRFWLTLGLSAVVGVAIVAVVAVLLGVLLPRLNDQVENSNRTLGVALSRQVDDFLRGSAAALERVAAEIDAQPDSTPERTRVIIDTLTHAHAPLDALYVLDASARVVDVGLPLERRQRRDELLGLDFSARGFVKAVRPAGSVLWSDSYLSQRGKIVVAATVPLRGKAALTTPERWTLVGEIDLERLSDHIAELGEAATVLPIILDRLGQVVAHPDAGAATRQENLGYLPLVQAGLAGRFATERFSLAGREYIGTVTPIGASGWLTLVAQPTESAFATMHSTLQAIAAGVAAAFALALLSAYLYGRALVRRVADFSRHVQAIADGDYAAPLPSSRALELANLALSMRRMANAILDREVALADSEERYRALFSDAPLAYQSIDAASLRLVEVNDAWLALLAYRRDEVIGRPITDFLDQRSLPILVETFPKFITDGRIDELMCDLRQKNGKVLTVLINGRIHRGPQGQARTHCILTDITERQRLEQARLQAEALLRHQAERALAMLELPKAAEQMDEAAFLQHGLEVAERLTGSQTSFLCFVNPDQRTFESITWSRDPCRGNPTAPADPLATAALQGIWAEALEQRGAILCDQPPAGLEGLWPAAGAGIERLISVPVIEGGVGRMLLGVGNKAEPYCEHETETARLIGQDIWRIVNQRRAEDAQRLAASVFSASTSGICIAAADQRIVSINPALTAITGYSSDEIIGQTPKLFSSGRQRIAFYREMWNCISVRGVWRGEIWNRRKNGEVFPAWLTITAVRNGDGVVTHYIGSFYDITERKRSEEHINFLAHHDPLTRLPNRTLLDNRIRQAIARSRCNDDHTAVFFLDLDRFKLINDTLGHDTGDRLLARIAELLTEVLRETETVARLGGDEFIIVVPGLTDVTSAATLAGKVLEVVSSPQIIDERPLHVTPSIGISVYPDDGEDASTLLRNADTAMYHAKERGRNNFQFFTPAMNRVIQERAAIEHDLHSAVERDQFELFYQPQVNCRSGDVTGMEALLRWRHPQRGLISPDRFIPIAEETGLIVGIGEWVLRAACRQARCWRDAGHTDLRIGVNLSARQLQQTDLCEQIVTTLATWQLPPSTLELELTESMLMADTVTATALLHSLAELGIRMTIDDFGTGYSSLAYLKRFPVARLKIDRSFVRDLTTDANDAAIVRAIVAMADSLKMEVIAEGVETVAQLHFLESHGCPEVQGYLFSRPRPAAEFDCFRFDLPPTATDSAAVVKTESPYALLPTPFLPHGE
ncbi:MAG: EAL domain-containing protein [Candidatus Accumulibacter sp.]|uniref:EAL domain-containing protein n=1 Tax=Candidatus Accumulibacter proximus TaxID=2954385 RepID=A0A935PYV5_9PROT|nr:EAL domain-containing protein [Candidatus Accumulibacter proximus]